MASSPGSPNISGYASGTAGRRSARHGSGANGSPMETTTQRAGTRRSASREASRELRQRPSPNVESGPRGPQTAMDWNDIAERLRERLGRLESVVTQHTYGLSQISNGQVHPSVIKKIEDLSISVDRRFAEGSDRIYERVNRVENDFRVALDQLSQLVHSINDNNRAQATPQSAPPGVEVFSCATPERGRDDQPQQNRDDSNYMQNDNRQ